MLVLTRKAGESIMVGDEICVKVAEIRGNRIRLAIEAPRSTSVHRSEIAEMLQSSAKSNSPVPAYGRDEQLAVATSDS